MENKKVYDCLVIGAGVVGASVFNKITRLGKSCLMIDKASDVATGASKANSGLVHAGYDPEPGSLKAEMNVEGNRLFPEICQRLGVNLKKCGAIVVGDDVSAVEKLFDRGVKNGVKVEILNQKQIRDKVPDINENISVALFAPDAYVVSPYLLTISLTDEGILNGGDVSLEEDLISVEKVNGIFEVKTQKGCYLTKTIVNSAGSGYNDVAKILGSEQVELEFRRGEYFVFDKGTDMEVPCTIFPLPTKLGKGVLVTPTIDGNFLVGPTSAENDGTTEVTREGLEDIRKKSNLILKDINFKNAIREFSGVRVISGDDFIIEKSKLVEGVVNLAGICSPGLTSAPAIAKRVCMLLGYVDKELKNLKKIEPYIMFKNLSKEEKERRVKADKNCCEIVCKCEEITKADIISALNRPLKVHSVDAVKRRTNAGMGRCQGGFCFSKVVKLIAQERGIDYCSVLKENRGSEVAVGQIREVAHD